MADSRRATAQTIAHTRKRPVLNIIGPPSGCPPGNGSVVDRTGSIAAQVVGCGRKRAWGMTGYQVWHEGRRGPYNKAPEESASPSPGVCHGFIVPIRNRHP